MQLIKRNNLAIVLIFLFQLAISQKYPSKNYTTLDGLPNNSIYSIFKDSRGLLWIGTENGISLYKNGVFKNFHQKDGFAHNSCRAIIEDKNNNLWFGSYGGGLTFYDGKNRTVFNEKSGLINNYIRKLFINKNHLFIGTEYGISVIDINSKKIIFSRKAVGKRGKFQIMGFFQNKSKVYFGTFNDGLWSIDLKSRKIILENINKPDIFSIHKNNDTLLFCYGDTNGRSLNKINIKDYFLDKPSNNHFGNTIFWDYATDKRGNIYATGNGINFKTGGLYKIGPNQAYKLNSKYGIDSFETWSLFIDNKNDLLYVGTIDKGLYVIDLKEHITFFPPSNFNKNNLDIVSINRIKEKNLILHKNGLLFLNSFKVIKEISNKNFFDFAHNHKIKYNYQNKDNYYKAFMEAKLDAIELKDIKIYDDKIWVNTSIGFFEISYEGLFKNYYPISLSSFHFINSNKLIYQIAYGYTVVYDNFKNNPKKFFYDNTNENNPVDVTSILPLDNTIFFFSKSKGLISYKNNKFYSFYLNNKWHEKELTHAAISNKKQIVTSNSNGDVFIIETKKGFKLLDKISNEKIIGNSISFLQPYKDYILIGTEKGINIYKNGVIRLIDEEQGLENKIFTTAFNFQDFLFVGTHNGLYKINLKKYFHYKIKTPKIKIDKIDINYSSINDNFYKWFNIQNHEIEFPYNQNSLSISLQPQNHPYPNKLEYRYKLLGIANTEYSNWSKNKTINLTYLPIGNYSVILDIKDISNGKTSTHSILNIKINPPFWRTYWFYLLITFLIFLIIYIVYQKRVALISQREKAKGIIQKRLAETKMEALQSQMNPHFIFNAMNSIQNYIIDNNTDEALMYMGEFAKLIRKTLINSSKQRITISDEVEYLHSYIKLENMRFKNKVQIIFKMDEKIDIYDSEIPPMLIQPFVENVFIHAFDTKSTNPTLQISTDLDNNQIVWKIEDNGKGISKEKINKLYESKGIKLTKERISLLNFNCEDSINIYSESDKGTCITIKLLID